MKRSFSGAFVKIVVVAWNQIDVMEYKTLPIFHFHRLNEANVEESAFVEVFVIHLLHDINAVLNLLFHQKTMDIF